MQVSVHVCTRRSRTHPENQDRAVLGSDVVADAPEVKHSRLDTPAVLAVLDGLGGHAAGEVASDVAARRIAGAEPPVDDVDAQQLLLDADAAVFAAADRDSSRHGMGTTVAVLVLDGNGGATAANVGDSTIWRVRDGELELISVPDRLGGGILQCLGGHVGSRIEPHVRHLELVSGDRLLLASDGLTDVVPSSAIASALAEDAAEGAEQLLRSVVAAGPPDDVTIMVVDVEG